MTTKRKGKKVNPKELAKREIMAIVEKALTEAGYEFGNSLKHGMTAGTVVVYHATCDVQLKPIVPKAGVDRYPIEGLEEEPEIED